jgi:PIN domain nuclease of toxin-antitoxin system
MKKVKAVLMVEMEISSEEDAKEELLDVLSVFEAAKKVSGGRLMVKNDFKLWLASRKDLEEMAEAGVLLPNPNVLVVQERRKR